MAPAELDKPIAQTHGAVKIRDERTWHSPRRSLRPAGKSLTFVARTYWCRRPEFRGAEEIAGRPAKALHGHLLEGTFRVERHGKLLGGEPLPVSPPHPHWREYWRILRSLQDEFQLAGSARERGLIVSEFADVAGKLPVIAGTRCASCLTSSSVAPMTLAAS